MTEPSDRSERRGCQLYHDFSLIELRVYLRLFQNLRSISYNYPNADLHRDDIISLMDILPNYTRDVMAALIQIASGDRDRQVLFREQSYAIIRNLGDEIWHRMALESRAFLTKRFDSKP